jgi:phosphoribosyl 1,2-cyclic phosphate phosphodiesterase
MPDVVFLGTGASTGVPVITCKCKTCRSKSKYNKRLRPSILIKHKRKNILVDAGPDIRQQALKYRINRLDVLILTHVHFDHIAGIDDLRIYNRKQKRATKCYLLKETYEELKSRCKHLFNVNHIGHTQSARFDFHVLDKKKKSFKINDNLVNCFSYFQDSKKVLGIRIENIAYITDIKHYNENIFDELKNLDVLILSCLREERSSVHFDLKEAVDFSKKINAKITYLTHLGHEMEYHTVSKKLCKNVKLAYDGLILKF